MMPAGSKGRARDKEKGKKKGILQRLPRLSRTSQTIIILALLVAMFVPTYLVYYQQPKMRASLQTSLVNMRALLAVEETPKSKLEEDLKRVEAETAAAKALYPDPTRVPELVDRLIALAKANDTTVTGTKVDITKLPSPRQQTKEKAPTERIDTILTIEMDLKGQVPHFQNFLLALDKEFPTARIPKIDFDIHSEEGKEDTCRLQLQVLCYSQEKKE